MNELQITNVRWTTDRLANGTYRGFAYLTETPHNPFATVDAGSELACLDGVRTAICRQFRKPVESPVVNDRGDRINVGGGYR